MRPIPPAMAKMVPVVDSMNESDGPRSKHPSHAELLAVVEEISSAVAKVSLPVWAEACDKTNPGCSQKWKSTVGPIVGIK